MWHDQPFSQRNKTSKIAAEVKVGGEKVKVGRDKKKEVGQSLKKVR